MSYISRLRKKRRVIPDGLWIKCVTCKEIIYAKKLTEGNKICPKCGHHYRLSARERITMLCDEGTFRELDPDMVPGDPLEFVDGVPYPEKQVRAKKKSGENEAVVTGVAEVDGLPFAIGVMDFAYMGGSMGSVVGEKITRVIEKGIELGIPVVTVSASGGVRMHEAIIGLMQMAKTSAALYKLQQANQPYISILTDPTTGGTTASFASLGDVIIAEPASLIGFAGPRVIKQTIRQDLPEGFQKAEFLLEHGIIDMVVPRTELKATLARILRYLTGNPPEQVNENTRN
jgi:acetyl-CoA carboxylase carboxyl transferase subunit beta